MATMMGTTFLGVKSAENPQGYSWQSRPFPVLQNPTDILARVHKTTICGTDLHILGGNVPNASVGLGLGHEGIVDIIEIGSEVKHFNVGDRVLCSCISACGQCKKCKMQRFGNCEAKEGSWSLGHTIDGMQSQFVRVPHADHSCYKLPVSCPRDSVEEDKYLMLADILPTSYEIGLVDGAMADGKTCAIVGVGPVGLAALLAARSVYKPKAVVAIDLNQERLDLAAQMGATHTINVIPGENSAADVREQILKLFGPDEDGVDVVVEAVGLPGGWYVAQEIVKPGGNIAVLGVHGQPVTFNLERMWYRNFTLTAGMVHGYSIRRLMDLVERGSLRADLLVSHRFSLSEIEEAYSLFNSRKDGALKMVLTNDGPSVADLFARQTKYGGA
eukprot:TRINITY_DN30960_c0_g1_i1.p1 TRINITY_DN30960_c0_g1~~TRINITY_DN30960_c0_g1_i1.p1  ORF type:complete len:387 (-),score=46.33 TRINITY_DN30960_c0_g1_i1:431-1591(-)